MSYVDTKLINCNRLASVEATSNNNTNPALFTNSLNESIRLNVGDKVSLERAFISEIGAGNAQTIEFKGLVTGKNAVSTYTDIEYKNKYYEKETTYDPKYRLGYYREINTTLVEDEEVELRDNLAPLVIGYYITSNEYPNYIQQPRRFAQSNDTRGSVPRIYDPNSHYIRKDGEDEGFCYNTINTKCICFADWVKKENYSGGIIYKQIVDNTRYTLFIKDKIAYSIGVSGENDIKQFPKKYHNGIFQEATYYRIREKIDIEVNKGFNTPSAVANQITNQLVTTQNENTFQILDKGGFPRTITKTIETKTYKPINAQNMYNFCTETYRGYEEQTLPVTSGNITQLAVDYIATFGYIGVKRPEIFEKGREMAKIDTLLIRDDDGSVLCPILDDDEGFQTIGEFYVADTEVVNKPSFILLNVEYTKDNLSKIRDYLDACALYPELWDGLEETQYYNDTKLGDLFRPTIKNSRFFHINPYPTNPENVTIYNETFGDDAFIQRAPPNNIPMTSVPIFFYYDDKYRDKYIEPNSFNSVLSDGLSYGFAEPYSKIMFDENGNETGYKWIIKLLVDNVGGVPVELYTDYSAFAGYKKLTFGRRIGYDFHSTAYSTSIITPYSGYSNVDIGTKASNDNGGSSYLDYAFTDTINHIAAENNDSLVTDIMPYMTQTYIGANNPAIEFNNENNRFELTRLHTANNIGNKFKAGSKVSSIKSESQVPPRGNDRKETPPDKNINAGSDVYKINPRPPQFGYSPTFKPYIRDDSTYRANVYPETATYFDAHFAQEGINTQVYQGFNQNIKPFTIFDSHGGIYIDNWGFDEDNWEDNLWDILGFRYEDVNAKASSNNVLTRRIDNENTLSLYRPTTNAEIVTTDTKVYVTNQYGANMYYTSLPYPTNVVDYRVRHETGHNPHTWVYAGDTGTGGVVFTAENAKALEMFNEVSVNTQSTTITASDLQKSVLRPYYTIRSSILEGFTAFQANSNGANLPIISIVDKYSAQGDYFLGNPSGIQFTITKPTFISDIVTSIHDSDGKYANVDRTSAVIYKIEKLKRAPVNLLEEILKDDKKKK